MSRRVEKDSSLARYLSEIGVYSILTKEQEMDIAKRAHARKKPEQLNRLVESNLSFVVKIANEYRNLGIPFEDLLNEGNIGLIEASQRYDHNKGTKFITYAIWWIRKSILKALSEQSSIVRVPNYQMKKVRKVRDTEQSLSRTLGRKPDKLELSKELDSTISKIDEILQIKLREVSIDEKVGREKDVPLSDYLVDDQSVNPEDELLKNESEDLVRGALGSLTPQEHRVIINRFGLAGGRSFTLKEIGQSMGLSRERIRQIEAQAKKKLRRIFAIHTLPRSPLKGPLPARLLQALKDGGTKRGRGRRVRSATGNGAMASAMPIGPGVSAMRVSETISVPSGGHRNLDRPI
jgi:RNA polymerase primary sigma factor